MTSARLSNDPQPWRRRGLANAHTGTARHRGNDGNARPLCQIALPSSGLAPFAKGHTHVCVSAPVRSQRSSVNRAHFTDDLNSALKFGTTGRVPWGSRTYTKIWPTFTVEGLTSNRPPRTNLKVGTNVWPRRERGLFRVLLQMAPSAQGPLRFRPPWPKLFSGKLLCCSCLTRQCTP